VGPERFGILVVDSSKRNFAVLLGNFYGQVLMGPVEVSNTRFGMECIVDTVRLELEKHGLKDLVAGIERTGRYHAPIRRALKAHWEVRMIHPFATKQLRQPADPGNKTDTTDIQAMLRAIVVGYGTQEQELPERWQQWRLVSRAQEDWVRKRATVRVQIQERLEALMPGYAALFQNLWNAPVGLALAESHGSASKLLETGREELCRELREANHVVRRDTLERILAWASPASPPDPCPRTLHQILRDQLRLHRELESQIQDYERELVEFLVETPFVLLLGIPGIHVVSAGSYAA
jgi:transposase